MRVVLVGAQVVRDAGALVVRLAAAELLEADVLAGHRADDVRAGDEHVRRAVGHDDEVGQRGGVHRAARARAEDERDLRDDARRRDVAAEDLRELRQRRDALLDARAAAVGDADERHAGAQREVHDLGDLLAVHLAEAAAEDREVLASRCTTWRPSTVPCPATTPSPAMRFFSSPKFVRAVLGERVELDEAARVEQRLDALAGGLLAARVLLLGGGRLGDATSRRS